MKERHNRLSVVKELIKNNRIDNQDTFLELLKKEGYNVTQATLSRAIRGTGASCHRSGNLVYVVRDDG